MVLPAGDPVLLARIWHLRNQRFLVSRLQRKMPKLEILTVLNSDRPMAQWLETRVLEIPAEEAFDLVADVEAYPEFLPLWQRAEVVARTADGYETVQTVGVGMLTRRFRTHTRLDRPRRILVTSSDGLFRALRLRWGFRPLTAHSCRVSFGLTCDVAAWWLKPTIEAMMAPTAQSMIDAFQARARSLAGVGRRVA